MDGDIAQFVSITNASEQVARSYLEMADNDVMQAVTLFFETPPDLQSSFNVAGPAPATSASASASQPHAAPHRQVASHHVGDHEVIHISSEDEGDDDDDDVVMTGYGHAVDVDNGAGAAAAAATVARTAQEDEDAAMARRLQEELYGESVANLDSDGVRAPIARTTETLVAPSGGGYDDFDDLQSEVLQQMRRRRQPPGSSNPFAQSVWDDPDAPRPVPAPGSAAAPHTRSQRLAELFRPPYELMSHLSWDDARAEGKEDKKWIMVNLQDMTDFNCQVLNRDIWKDDLIAQLIRENFIFLQYPKDDPQATEYQTFYFTNRAHENPDNFPHVSIIDPRTGEQVKVWSGIPFPTAQQFHTELVDFLDRYSLSQNSKNPVPRQKRPQRVIDVDRMTEEEMLAMAMQNSLETNGNGSGSGSEVAAVHDPDALTKSTELGRDKGKAVAVEADVTMQNSPVTGEAPGASSSSVFAGIRSDRPHAEPANDPATTTRIQFRHANGRVIRRFSLSDPVLRIYEWLKAEPLEGKSGVEFELKAMPQGHDLLESRNKTIAEAGLRQATVMVEFIED